MDHEHYLWMNNNAVTTTSSIVGVQRVGGKATVPRVAQAPPFGEVAYGSAATISGVGRACADSKWESCSPDTSPRWPHRTHSPDRDKDLEAVLARLVGDVSGHTPSHPYMATGRRSA